MGLGEFLVLGFILLFILSASQLGRIGNALGKFVYSFRKASRGGDLIDATPTLKSPGAKGPHPDAEQVDEKHR